MVRLLFLAFLFLLAAAARSDQEGAQSFTLDGRLYDSASQSQPLLDAHVTLTIDILDPTKNCILYEESQVIATSNTNGYFTAQLGGSTTASKRTANDPGNTMSTVYQNMTAVSGKQILNGAVCSYAPAVGDVRYVRIRVLPSTLGVTSTLAPDLFLDSAPSAVVAESLQGLGRSDLLQLNPATHLTQAEVATVFSNSNYPILQNLLAGQYLAQTTAAGAQLPSYTTSAPPASPAVGSIWYDSTSNSLKYYNGSVQTVGAGGSSGVSSLTVGSNLTANGTAGGTLSAAGTIDLVDSGVGAGTYTKVTVNAKGLVTGKTTLAEADIPTLSTSGKVAGSAITGTIGGSTILNTSGDITTTGTTTTATLSATDIKGRDVQIFDSGTHQVTLQTPSTLAGNYSLTLPAALPGSSGMVLSSDTSGVTSWTALGGSSFGSQTANTFLAAPNGSSGAPSFRTVVAADLPSISTGLSGTLPVANGGTGITTGAANLIFATPNGASGAPSFRALASADLPSISSGLTGTLPVANGGTGTTTGSITGTSALTFTAGGTNSSVTLTPTGTGATVLGGNIGIGTSSPLAKLQVGTAPTATANFGVISLGNGAFDGSTSGFFAGSANGTDQAINNVTGYSGNFVDYQINGASKFKVDATGKIYGDGSQLTNLPGTGTVNTGTASTLAYYSSAGTAVSTLANGSQFNILVGGASGVPTWGSINLASSTAVGTSVLPVANGGTGTNSGSITGTGALTFAAGGTNSSVTLAPTGTGATVLGGNVGVGTSSPLAKLHVGVAPTATANFGVVSLGDGAYDGTTVGKFAGSVNGTMQAINAASGYSGNLVDYQVAGVSKFKVDATGKVTGDGSGLSNIAPSYSSQTGNTFLGAPNGSAGTPTFRTLVSADLPSISSGLSGTLPVANGGTGTTTGSIVGTGALTFAAGGTNSSVTLTPTGTGSTILGGSVGIGTSAPNSLLHINGAPTATANYGVLSLGSGAFDGTTTGNFTGSASGTVAAINATGTFTGSLLDMQAGGTSKFKVDGYGRMYINSTSYDVVHVTTNTDALMAFSSNGRAGFQLQNGGGNWQQLLQTDGTMTFKPTYNINDGTASALTLTSGGKVGMGGNNSPAYTLDVTGTINASAILVGGSVVGSSTSSYWNQTGTNQLYYTLGNVGINQSNPGATLDVNGHIANSSTSTPSLGTCGTSASITGNDTRGLVTLGTGSPSSCTINFASAYATAPICVVTPLADAGSRFYISSITTSSLVINLQTGASSKKFYYICMQ